MIPKADPLMRAAIKPEVQRFLAYCRRRAELHKAESKKSRFQRRVSDRADIVVEWLRQHGPATASQIAESQGITRTAFFGLQRRHSDKIAQAGTLPRTGKATPAKLWKAA